MCYCLARMQTSRLPVVPASATSKKPRVVYVLGAGKSGSTILGVTLGNCEDMFFTGELFSWLVESGSPVLEGAEREAFWGRIRDEVDGADDLYGNEVVRYLERSLARFRIHRTLVRRRLRPRYQQVMLELFTAIGRIAGAAYIVDTSHFPMRARELQAIGGIELYLVFLSRDPRDVVASYSRHVDGSALKRGIFTLGTNADLWLTYLLSVLVFLRQPRERRLFVRYEDLVEKPEEVLREILNSVNSPAPTPDLSRLRTGFAVRGNRLLLSPEVAFESRTPPPPRRSLLTSVLQLPWTLLFPRLRPALSGTKSQATSASHNYAGGR
jgi:hypothetical protein